MSRYQYHREPCAMCGDYLPMRDMTKLYLGKSHEPSPVPKKLCCVCDTCYPKLLDFLEVSEPDEPESRPYRPYRPRQWCRKCVTHVGKTAKFCPYCGDELATQNKEI